MLLQNLISSLPLQELNHPLAKLHEVRLHVLRTDLTNNEVYQEEVSKNIEDKYKKERELKIKNLTETILINQQSPELAEINTKLTEINIKLAEIMNREILCCIF